MAHSPSVLILGTGPNSSKTHVCLGLLRLLVRRGVPVTPFKAITVVEEHKWRVDPDGCPIPHHVAAARVRWRPTMSPAIVRQTAPDRGELRVLGQDRGPVRLLTPDTLDGATLSAEVLSDVRTAIVSALDELSGTGVLVVEGAGSPTDAKVDLANILVARRLDTSSRRLVLSTYCWAGGSPAAVVGTYRCLPPDLRAAVVGFVLNRSPSSDAVRRWSDMISTQTGIRRLAVVGDLAHVPSADAPTTDDALADPWADALADGLDEEALGRLLDEDPIPAARLGSTP